MERNTQMLTDPRFEAVGLYTDEYEVQANNGVLAILSNQPHFHKYVATNTEKKKHKY